MDQLTAYRILQLRPGADTDEIKEAYAELSKRFHPEEHPEEFQQIHEAFRYLMKAARGSRRDRHVLYHRPEQREENPENEDSGEEDIPKEDGHDEEAVCMKEDDFVEEEESLTEDNSVEEEESRTEDDSVKEDERPQEEGFEEFDFETILARDMRMRSEGYRFDDILSRDDLREEQSLEDLRSLTEDIREQFQNSHTDEKQSFSERRQEAARLRRAETRRRKENYQRQRDAEARIKDEKLIARMKEKEAQWDRKEQIRELKRRQRENRGHIGLILNVLIPLALMVISFFSLSGEPGTNEPMDTIMSFVFIGAGIWFLIALVMLIVTKIKDRIRKNRKKRQE